MRCLTLAVLLGLPTLVSAQPDPPVIAPTEHRSPSEERKALRLPPGFDIQLVAAEPDIQKPINMAFDARGRLWVTCSVEYPFAAPDGKGRDSVKVLEDFGPDGRARKITTFADDLNIPIGILPYQDGAIVYSIPGIWRLRDTDGDGKCDQGELLYGGFGHRDTHGMVNGLVLGFDGWLYCCHGYSNDSDVKGRDGSEVRMNSGNTFRVRLDGSRVEMMCRGQVNPFGQCLDPLGNLYTACCHSKPITQLLRGAVYTSFSKPHDGLGFGPDMVHEYRGSTALCGLNYYDADHFPQPFRGNMFLGDVVNNVINYFRIDRDGGTYTAYQQPNFVVSDDPWFRPVDIKLGPDGALYVADFYNRIIGHYEVPLNHPGRDRTSGRIWRIVYTGIDGHAPPPKAPRADWTKASVAELVQDLAHPNLTVRMTATHQLVERGPAAIPEVKALLQPETPGIPRAHALWVLDRLKALDDDTLARAVKDKDLAVRTHAMRIIAERPAPPAQTRLWQLAIDGLKDEDRLVQRCAADAIGHHPDGRSISLKPLLALRHTAPANDPFLVHVVRIAMRNFIAAGMADADWTTRATPANWAAMVDVALGVAGSQGGDLIGLYYEHNAKPEAKAVIQPAHVQHMARYGTDAIITPDAILELIRAARPENKKHQFELFQALQRGVQERGTQLTQKCATWAVNLGRELLRSTRADELQCGIELAVSLRAKELMPAIATIGANRQQPEAPRVAALAALASLDGPRSLTVLAPCLADSTESVALRERVAQAIAGVNSADARTMLLTALPTAPARLATDIAAGLANNAEGAEALLQSIAAGKASPQLLLERPVQVKLDAIPRRDFRERIAKLTEGLPPADAKLARLLHERSAGFAQASPDSTAGAKVFTQHCAACHQIGNAGTRLGPQLDGIGVRGLDRLLEDILDPNRNVDQSFRATTLRLKSGQVVSGLVLRTEGQVIVMADAQGKEQRFGVDQVDQREATPLSPMPANWGEQIPEKDFYDLMAYLLSQRAK